MSKNTKKSTKKVIPQPTNLQLLQAIHENRTAIGENRTAIHENRIAIEGNRTAIHENRTAIGENRKAIEGNRTAIHENRTAIGENRTAIHENRIAIEGNQTDINGNRTAIHENQVMLHDLIDTIQSFAEHTDQRFDQLENRVINIEETMPQLVTKSYLDNKLAEVRGDFVTTVRQEDHKVTGLVDILRKRNLITDTDLKRIKVMSPFAKS